MPVDELNINKKRYLITPDIANLKGDPGEDGADGNINSFLPINTSNLNHDGALRTNEGVDDLLDELLHVVLVVLSFAADAGNVFEQGQSFSSLAFTWTIGSTITSQSIAGTNVTPPTLEAADRTAVVSFSPDLDDDGTIVLSVDDGTGLPASLDSKSYNINFYWKVHWGKAVIPGAINSAFILGLSDESLQGDANLDFTLSTASTEYIWIAAPSSYGDLLIKAGGFIGGFESKVIVSHSNGSGAPAENYNVYRSTHDNLGSTNITIE